MNEPDRPRRLLDVRGLCVSFGSGAAELRAVRSLDLHLDRGETLAVVGESGSGKSVTSLAIMRLVEYGGGRITAGEIELTGRDGRRTAIHQASDDDMRRLRGADMSMIFQEPMTSLNPVFTVGAQIVEAIELHRTGGRAAAVAAAVRMLDRVRIPDARGLMKRYPHELSGGMRQRVMIAMALACEPSVLIADEPTTALDVTIQAQILLLIRELQQDMAMGVVFITHDMGVVAEMADRVMVMRHGEVLERDTVHAVFERPAHAYTRTLLAAVAHLGAMTGSDGPARFALPGEADADGNPTLRLPAPARPARASGSASGSAPLLQVRDLTTRFDLRSGILSRITRRVHAVEKVSFDLHAGETLSLVGESGCGKTTTGRSLLSLARSCGGSIRFEGQPVVPTDKAALNHLRRHIQFVFQDPFASLNPRMRVGDCIREPMIIQGMAAGDDRVASLMQRVGLDPATARRWPHEFSGGQRQRICIARALSVDPQVLIADEAVSALDVSIRAQIVNLLIDLQDELGIACLFISHDMAVVERISHRVAVMYLGQIVEIGPRRAVFENPQHAYTRRLLAAVPKADPRARHRIEADAGEIPSPIRDLGDEPEVPALVQVGEAHFVARHRVGGLY